MKEGNLSWFDIFTHTHTHTPSFSHAIRGARLRPWNYLKGHHIQTPTYKMPWPCPISPRYVPSIRYSWGFYVPLIFLVKMAEDWNHFITLPLNFTRVSTLIALSHLSLTYLMPSIFLIQKKRAEIILLVRKRIFYMTRDWTIHANYSLDLSPKNPNLVSRSNHGPMTMPCSYH